MGEFILKCIITGAITIITSIITKVLLPELTLWIQSKVQNERLKAYIQDISTTVSTTVDFLEQTMVSQYKADGSWNKDTQEAVLQTAVQQVMDSITIQTKHMIEDQGIDVKSLITRHIESYIIENKNKK